MGALSPPLPIFTERIRGQPRMITDEKRHSASPSLQEVLEILSERKKTSTRLFVTLDGPCATGKTTLARQLAEACQGQVIHTDDFVIPHARKTPEQLAIPGGNCDVDRLVREVVLPYTQGRPVRYRRYDFRADRLLPAEPLAETGLLILEGSYCNLPPIRERADLRLFLTASRETRVARLRKRESPASLQRFFDLWIPLEDAYFDAFHLPDEGCLLLRSSENPAPESGCP